MSRFRVCRDGVDRRYFADVALVRDRPDTGVTKERPTTMTAIGLPLSRRRATLSDTQIEAARYRVDLRVHALIVLFVAASIAYLGYRVWDLDVVTVAGEPVRIMATPDFVSNGVFAIVIAIATICLIEARRSWREAAIIRVQDPTVARM
jgi:hypothetical protein